VPERFPKTTIYMAEKTFEGLCVKKTIEVLEKINYGTG
jgi:hypothetical protein